MLKFEKEKLRPHPLLKLLLILLMALEDNNIIYNYYTPHLIQIIFLHHIHSVCVCCACVSVGGGGGAKERNYLLRIYYS